MTRWQRLVLAASLVLSPDFPSQGDLPSTPKKEPGQSESARTDNYGDPLPPVALLRLGTLRHRNLYLREPTLRLLDGKTVLTSTPIEVRWLDLATGRLVRIWSLPKGYAAGGFSPDGRLVLLTDQKEFRLWSLAERKELRAFRGRGVVGPHVAACFFSPNGKLVATWSGAKDTPGLVRVWDVASGKDLWQEGAMDNREHGLDLLGFLPDGKTLIVLDQTTMRASLRDPVSGKEHRSFETMPRKDSFQELLSPDGKSLFLGTAGTEVRVWDVASGKELPRLGGHKGEARSIAISRDGKTVLTGGTDSLVLVWDWPAGTLRRTIDLSTDRQTDGLSISADGKRAEINILGEKAVRFFDLQTGKALPEMEAHHGIVYGVAVAPDGKVVSGGDDRTFRVWELRTGRQLHVYRTEHPVGFSSLALSADGRLVATADLNWGKVALHERDTGRLTRTLEIGGEGVAGIAFSPTGRLLAVSGCSWKGGARYFLGLWDAEMGREVRRIEALDDCGTPVFSPDGRLLAGLGRGGVRLWEAATGRERPGLGQKEVHRLAFTPDGRGLACADPRGITLWELASGKQRWRIEIPAIQFYPNALCFSPDGRGLAWAAEPFLLLFDVRRVRETRRFSGHDHWVCALAFAPDGRRLVSGSVDTTLLIWDVTGVLARKEIKVSPDALTSAWDGLTSTDAEAAYRALVLLAETPGQSVPLLGQRLRPARPPDRNRLARLLEALDDSRFAERERATRELRRMSDLAGPALRRFLAGGPSAEARDRVKGLLDRLEGPVTDPEGLRHFRAVEVLEAAETPEARELLEKLAQGAPEAGLTQEAKAALQRLAKRLRTIRGSKSSK
jgi:WD40 repeat protein/uncharacterized protein YjiS (DUF1127 family)